MYFLVGILAALSLFLHFAQSNSTASEPQHQAYRQAMDDNKAYWKNLKDRYNAFDVLQESNSPSPVPRDFRGYWEPANDSSFLYFISDESTLTKYDKNYGTTCFRPNRSRDLLYYGDQHVVEKYRTMEDRFYYRLKEHNVLNIELIYTNSEMGSTDFHKIRAGDISDIEFCNRS